MMYKMIDLFAGIGGIRIAFENNGVVCVGSSEIDPSARDTYANNFGEIPLGDVTKIKSNDLPDFDILSAGFPCQPFSIGGLRRGFEDTRGTLFFEVARIISDRKPKAFLLENVAGLVSHDKGKTLEKIEECLTELGYIISWKLMNAKDYGVPQNRNRWYCIGFRKDLNVKFEDKESNGDFVAAYRFPRKHKLEYSLKDIISRNDDEAYKISDIASRNINKFIDEFKESNRYNADEILIANDIRPSRCGFRNDGISPCLTAKMGTGGNNVPVFVNENRKLTEKECLKIMSFPDWYKIRKGAMSSYKQIGNSVVVGIIDKLAVEMIRVLEKAR